MADEKHVSPEGLEFSNPENSIKHEDVAPIYVSPEESEKEENQDPYKG